MLSKRSIAGIVIAAAVWGAALPAVAYAAEPTAADLEAVIRALGFLETLQRDGVVDTAIAYAPNTPAARAQAAHVAERLAAMSGPNKSAMHAIPVPIEALSQGNDPFDVIYLMPGASAEAAAVLEAVHKRHVITISNDPTCIESKCCVLMIRTGRGVEIVLQTALADAVGARFSAVFAMMVKRQ